MSSTHQISRVSISTDEWKSRISEVQKSIQNSDNDCIIVSDSESIFYLTGLSYEPLERPFFIVIPKNGSISFIMPVMEKTHIEEAATIPDDSKLITYTEYPAKELSNWSFALHKVLEASWKKIAIEPSMMSDIKDVITSMLNHSEGLDVKVEVSELLRSQRYVKSKGEIAMIRQACRFAELAVEIMMKETFYGVSVLQVYSTGSRGVTMLMMKQVGFDPLTCKVIAGPWPAPFSCQPHGIPHIGDRLLAGPIVLLACIRVHGYSAECERTVFIGQPSEEEQKYMDVMMAARDASLSKLLPGAACADIDKAAMEVFKKANCSQYVLHRTGHGIGISTHEGPWLAEGCNPNDTLVPGMVVSMEPGLYVPGVGGFRHSDTVLITKTGYELLTNLSLDVSVLSGKLKGAKIMPRLKSSLIFNKLL